ncbi:hypothetical protein ACFV2U_48080 [Streptomyces sp. NPDC059697]|uniref:hypothetical protein n=1 Tax=Streptomyces sp. NPDC059697 TaxID=3346912 RepID=UPI0036C752A3
MARTRTQRLTMLTASTALAAAGALLPTSAFAAPAHTAAVTMAPVHGGGGHDRGSRDGNWNSHYGRSDNYGRSSNYGRNGGGQQGGKSGNIIIINNNIPIVNNNNAGVGVTPNNGAAANTPANAAGTNDN